MSWPTQGSSHSYVPFSVSMPSFAFGPSHILFAGNIPHLSPNHPHPGDLSSHFRSQPCSLSLALCFHWVLHCWCCTVWWLSHSRARTMSSSGLSRSSAACALNTSRGAIHFIVCVRSKHSLELGTRCCPALSHHCFPTPSTVSGA